MTVRMLWVQELASEGHLPYSREGIDGLVAMCRGTFSHLLLATRRDDGCDVMFNAEYCRVTPERIDGVPPGQYFVERCLENGIIPGAWFYCGWWLTYVGMYAPPDPAWNLRNQTCGQDGPNWVDWSSAGMRRKAANHVADIARNNPGLGCVALDYARLFPGNTDCIHVTAADVTAYVAEVKARLDVLDSGMELAAAFGRSEAADAMVRRDPVAWSELCDYVLSMTYDWPPTRQAEAWAYLRTLPNQERVLPGLGTVTRTFEVTGDLVWEGLERIEIDQAFWSTVGKADVHVFDSAHLTQAMVDVMPPLETAPPLGDEIDLTVLLERVDALAADLRAQSAELVALAEQVEALPALLEGVL